MLVEPVGLAEDEFFAELAQGMTRRSLRADDGTELVVREDLKRTMTLARFMREAWSVVEPGTTMRWNWHLDAIAEHLEAFTDHQIKTLVITMPPRHMKSLAVSVFWPAWVWTYRAWARFLFASYAEQLAVRDSVKTRRVIKSNWYQARWGELVKLTGDQNVKTRFENEQTGYRLCTSVGGSATGEGGDFVVVDDPHKADEVESDVKRQAVLDWWDAAMTTRLNDPDKGGHVLVAQRTHEADLIGHVLESDGNAVELRLPAEYEPTRHTVTVLGWEDPRTEEDQLLWEGRFGEEAVARLKKQLGSYRAAGQLQQRPAPAEGGIFKRAWWRHYRALPERFDEEIMSWDMTFKETTDTDFVVGQHWGRVGADFYLIDQVRRRMDFVRTLRAFVDFVQVHPNARRKLVEDKANGPAVISALRRKIPGIVPVPVNQVGKEARAHAVSPYVEAGNVWLPEPTAQPWVDGYVDELCTFPNAKHDDQVDATTQALERLAKGARIGQQEVVQWG